MTSLEGAAPAAPDGGPVAHLVSVNAGKAIDAEWAGELRRTAIDKRPLDRRVWVHRLGVDGDEQADRDGHGSTYQAVYAYAREDLDWWAGQLGRELRPGIFGENLTVQGVEVTRALVGERWRIGEVVFEVTQPRIPCSVFRNWLGEKGWVKRFAEAGRPGAYLRVVAEGEIGPGDPVEVVTRPAHHATIRDAFRVNYGDHEPLDRLREIAEPPPGVRKLLAKITAS